MLDKRNSIPERIISLLMIIFAVGLIYAVLFLNPYMPKDILGIADFIYSSII